MPYMYIFAAGNSLAPTARGRMGSRVSLSLDVVGDFMFYLLDGYIFE